MKKRTTAFSTTVNSMEYKITLRNGFIRKYLLMLKDHMANIISLIDVASSGNCKICFNTWIDLDILRIDITVTSPVEILDDVVSTLIRYIHMDINNGPLKCGLKPIS